MKGRWQYATYSADQAQADIDRARGAFAKQKSQEPAQKVVATSSRQNCREGKKKRGNYAASMCLIIRYSQTNAQTAAQMGGDEPVQDFLLSTITNFVLNVMREYTPRNDDLRGDAEKDCRLHVALCLAKGAQATEKQHSEMR